MKDERGGSDGDSDDDGDADDADGELAVERASLRLVTNALSGHACNTKGRRQGGGILSISRPAVFALFAVSAIGASVFAMYAMAGSEGPDRQAWSLLPRSARSLASKAASGVVQFYHRLVGAGGGGRQGYRANY